MTSTPNDGGPAFPHGNRAVGGDPGMTLRDWFAGQALIHAASHLAHPSDASRAAYAIADAMLKMRAKQ